MSFDESLARVRQRVGAYRQSRQPEVIMGESALADAEDLWSAAGLGERPTPEVEEARRAAGWLYFLRHLESPDPAALARAILLFSPLVDGPDAIPDELGDVLGPAADPATQASVGTALLRHSAQDTDIALVDVAIGLLTASVTAASPDDPKPGRLTNLGAAHQCRHQLVGELSDLDRAVERGEQAVACAPAGYPDLPVCLASLSGAYQRRYVHAGMSSDLDRAIELGDQAMGADADRPDVASVAAELGAAYQERFERAGALSDLDRAIELGERTTGTATTWQVCDLGRRYYLRYERCGASADLDQAIELAERAVRSTPPGDSDLPRRLVFLWGVRKARHDDRGTSADLDRAIAVGDRALEASPATHPDRAWLSCQVGHAHLLRYDRDSARSDLERGVGLGEQALRAGLADNSLLGTLLNLTAAYQQRYEHSGAESDLDRAIELGEQAATSALRDPSARAHHLSNLSNAYRSRFDRTGLDSDLGRATTIGEQAVAMFSPDDPGRAMALSNLANACQSNHGRTGALAELERAISFGEQALAASTEDRDRGMWLSNLGGAYQRRHECLGQAGDARRAIELGERSVAATPADHPDFPARLSNLSNAYRSRHDRTGESSDVERAIELGEQAVRAVPDHHPAAAMCLANLGNAYRGRYERSGSLPDMERALRLAEQAVDATPSGHRDKADWLSNLAGAHLARHDHTGTLSDVERAIELGALAVRACPPDHPGRTNHLINLADSYRRRYERTKDLSDLAQALSHCEQSIGAISADHPDRAARLSALGSTYQVRYEHTGTRSDLERAIECGEQAVQIVSDTHPARAVCLLNLGNSYQRRHLHGGAPSDLDRAIAVGEQAVHALPPDHPHHAMALAGLGNAYRWRHGAGGQGVDTHRLRALARQVAEATTASPSAQAQACRVVGSLALALREYPTAVELFDRAVALLPLTSSRDAEWADQEHRLGEHVGTVGEAVAAHCAIDDPVGAVEAAELGRGIILAAGLDTRTDLGQEHPGLAARLKRVRDLLNIRGGQDENPAGRTGRRKQLWAEHDELLAEIRKQPGHSRFLLPPRLDDLRPAAAGGAVVLVNASQYRGDAIIVTSDSSPVVVPLPNLTLFEAIRHIVALWDATHDNTRITGGLKRQRVLTDVLSWLWDTTVQPILDGLPPTEQRTSRVWWLPVGALGLFPLHAAGRPGQPGALDRVVSSYTPTLRALAHARARPPAPARRQLTVALAHTPGLRDLHGTAKEAEALHAHHPDTPPLTDHDATTGNVLAALPEATWAHFACHASTDPVTPSRGGLHLHDGILPTSAIGRLHLAHAELAYLSACSTAHREWRQADEALHLASAFQLAGFRHVIASLWPLDDQTAVTAAHAFYQRLPAADHAAATLHHVTRRLRADHPDRPDLWAPLIHSGP